MYLDLFSGVDYYFFNLSFLQGGFVLFSCFWVFYLIYYSYFLNFNLGFLANNLLFYSFLDGGGKWLELKMWFIYLWSFFVLILMSNLLGLFPYVYGVTTNIYFVLLFSLWGWLTMVLSSLFLKISGFISHFCPSGAPLVLGGFLSVVEVVSMGIRPGTLTLRLVAKMTTGHMLMGLLTLSSCSLYFSGSLISILCLLFLAAYLGFEVAICMIQGNVYFMLFKSYTQEHL